MEIINPQDKKWMHYFFEFGIISKGLNAILEIIAGTLLLFLSNEKIVQIVVALTSEELSQDPRDYLARFFIKTAQNLSVDSRLFGSMYLLSHGIIKIGLVLALYKRKIWAYPLAITVFGLFIIYQIYKFTYSHSLWLIIFSILDIIVIIATWFEYKRIKNA